MKKYLNLAGTMIGYHYPFFLNNVDLGTYYLYQITTPGYDHKDLVPYLSMEKISERTKSEPNGKDSDVLSMCVGSKKSIQETGVKFLDGILKKEETTVISNGKGYPLIKMVPGNNMQRSMIIGLRDTLRWRNYKFFPGRYVDMLWTSRDFLLFKICGSGNEIWLEPVAAYRNSDMNLEKPLKVDWGRINYPKEHFTGQSRASDLNRTLKRLEWNSFDRRSFR